MLLIPAHRACAATMTEDEPLTGGQAERLKAALREMDAKMGHAVHYGPGDVPLYGEGSVGAQWTDEQADAVINPGARVFNLSASQISIGVKAATRTGGHSMRVGMTQGLRSAGCGAAGVDDCRPGTPRLRPWAVGLCPVLPGRPVEMT